MEKVGRIDDLEIRTKEFALRIIELFTSLPKKIEAQIIGKQNFLKLLFPIFVGHLRELG